jgi:hypothetical protein
MLIQRRLLSQERSLCLQDPEALLSHIKNKEDKNPLKEIKPKTQRKIVMHLIKTQEEEREKKKP